MKDKSIDPLSMPAALVASLKPKIGNGRLNLGPVSALTSRRRRGRRRVHVVKLARNAAAVVSALTFVADVVNTISNADQNGKSPDHSGSSRRQEAEGSQKTSRARKPATKESPARKSSAKRSPTNKSATKRAPAAKNASAAKKAPAKKAAAASNTRAPAKKSSPRKSTSSAKKTGPRATTARKR